jgi:hypothetical protein
MTFKTIAATAALLALFGFASAADASGCRVKVYWDANFGGESWTTDHDVNWVGDHWNDQISSIKVFSGVWEFYWDTQYGGESMRLHPGRYSYVGDHWNDQISSFRCVHPTD